MNNRPFFSTNTNVYDQSVYSAAPTNFNGQHVLVSQEQQQKLFDTLNTSIVGLPYGNFPMNSQCPPHFLQAQRQFVPGGVMFSFCPQPMPQPQGYMMQQISCPSPAPNNFYPTNLEQQIAATGLQKHGLETLQYQQHLANNPFQLRFHRNSATSCSDIPVEPMQIPNIGPFPDFNNLFGVVSLGNQEQRNINAPQPNSDWLANTFPTAPTIDPPRNIKRLVLSHEPEKPQGRVADAIEIDRESKNETGRKPDQEIDPKTHNKTDSKTSESKKKVCFADEAPAEGKKEDKSSQISCRCNCNGKEKESKSKDTKKKSRPKSAKKKKKEEPSPSASESSDEDTLPCCPKQEKTKKKPDDESDSQYSSTEVSE